MVGRLAAQSEAPRDLVRRAGEIVLGVLLPRQCLLCRSVTTPDGPDGLCAACWQRIQFLSEPMCRICGVPGGAAGIGNTEAPHCGACLAAPPSYGRGRAVFVYDEASRQLVTHFKFGDGLEAVPTFGRWMARAGADLLSEADILVPVPLHWRRLVARRFNQAAVLAAAIERETALPVAVDALVRARATRHQVGLSERARARNVAGAFRLGPRGRVQVEGRRVVLVDDVLTSGATVEACAKALLRGGAAAVDVLTLGRVP